MLKYIRLGIMVIVCGILFSAAGCRTKLPAGDVDINRLYANEIAILKDPNLSTSSLDKYNAACIIAQNVDFSYLRDIQSMDAIFGLKDGVKGAFEGQEYILYTYKFKNKSIQFRFSLSGNAIMNGSVKEIE
ncbi:MAG: hypothetical protein ACYC4Q_09660 [Victivallaceae bacterium]